MLFKTSKKENKKPLLLKNPPTFESGANAFFNYRFWFLEVIRVPNIFFLDIIKTCSKSQRENRATHQHNHCLNNPAAAQTPVNKQKTTI